ncbi:YciI family protein [Hyunsoonleella ulvae]|uniref:YciI family protein n=1 Tax=Hyunsoonleella ulvae TaxID=2799948 RepID=UPI00193A4080|nr:YciI family protein [Hyunsoonleella ulvae]
MKKTKIIYVIPFLVILGCKDATSTSTSETNNASNKGDATIETITEAETEITKVIEAPKKTAKQIKEELTAKGYKIFYDIDPVKKDTFLMQQYYLAFLKKGPIRGQNEEEAAALQKEHLAHLTKMYELGYADISGPFGDDGDIRGITIYNVPTLNMADSLANSDPMVKAGRLEIEIHPWWAAKGFLLR